MLFNSSAFIFLFLPITVISIYLLKLQAFTTKKIILAAASLIFYSYSDIKHIPLLLISTIINFFLGKIISNSLEDKKHPLSKIYLISGITFNLTILFAYKYFNFFISELSSITHEILTPKNISLPLGISFFTFTQTAYLVDVFKGDKAERKFINYSLFVWYFPHQIAGPIFHHKEILPQFRKSSFSISGTTLATGLSIFFIALAKKILIADSLADIANPIFKAAAYGVQPNALEAWSGTLAYMLQIYFDFSAYCDMAIGLSYIFGIKLPINFNSPYKSTSIIQFWRNWHITLSRFLRDYLYIPLGGNKKSELNRYINLLITMLLGGLWHGASWNFLFWGGLHGVYLVINHLFIFLQPKIPIRISCFFKIKIISWTITMASVAVAWVFFRAPDFKSAVMIINSMFHLNISDSNYNSLSAFPKINDSLKVMRSAGGLRNWIQIIISITLCLVTPNLQSLFQNYSPTLNHSDSKVGILKLRWKPDLFWAIIISIAGGIAISRLGSDSQFLYFNF